MNNDTPPNTITCDTGEIDILSCESLLRTNPERVLRISPASHPPFYAVSNVLCLGTASQVLCPVNVSGGRFSVLQESWTYGLEMFKSLTLRSLRSSPSGKCRTIQEAAPLNFIWSTNFWHWILEGASRIAVLESLGFQGVYIVPPFDHVPDTLEILRIPRQRIVYWGEQYMVKRLVVSAHMPPDRFTPATMQALRILRERFSAELPGLPATRRCYVKRTATRKVRNESDVLAMLQSMGFEVMIPEEQPSVRAQLDFMRNVQCSVMPHGANCALAFLQPENTHFLELFGMSYVNNCNGPMAAAAGLNHYQMTEKSSENLTFDMNRDFDVDVDFLRYRLKRILHR